MYIAMNIYMYIYKNKNIELGRDQACCHCPHFSHAEMDASKLITLKIMLSLSFAFIHQADPQTFEDTMVGAAVTRRRRFQ